MNYTYNRTPTQLPVKNLDEQYFNFSQFKGLCDNENYVAIDQQTFSKAINVYVDQNNQLSSRPAFKFDNRNITIDEQISKLENIIKVQKINNVCFYFVDYGQEGIFIIFRISKNYYKLSVEENSQIVYIPGEYENGVMKDGKYFIMSDKELKTDIVAFNIGYDNENEVLNTYTIKDVVYIPTTKVILGTEIKEFEAKNVLTNNEITEYRFDESVITNTTDFINKNITVTIDGIDYNVIYKKDLEQVIVNIQGLYLPENFEDFSHSQFIYSEQSSILCNLRSDSAENENYMYSAEGVFWTKLALPNTVYDFIKVTLSRIDNYVWAICIRILPSEDPVTDSVDCLKIYRAKLNFATGITSDDWQKVDIPRNIKIESNFPNINNNYMYSHRILADNNEIRTYNTRGLNISAQNSDVAIFSTVHNFSIYEQFEAAIDSGDYVFDGTSMTKVTTYDNYANSLIGIIDLSEPEPADEQAENKRVRYLFNSDTYDYLESLYININKTGDPRTNPSFIAATQTRLPDVGSTGVGISEIFISLIESDKIPVSHNSVTRLPIYFPIHNNISQVMPCDLNVSNMVIKSIEEVSYVCYGYKSDINTNSPTRFYCRSLENSYSIPSIPSYDSFTLKRSYYYAKRTAPNWYLTSSKDNGVSILYFGAYNFLKDNKDKTYATSSTKFLVNSNYEMLTDTCFLSKDNWFEIINKNISEQEQKEGATASKIIIPIAINYFENGLSGITYLSSLTYNYTSDGHKEYVNKLFSTDLSKIVIKYTTKNSENEYNYILPEHISETNELCISSGNKLYQSFRRPGQIYFPETEVHELPGEITELTKLSSYTVGVFLEEQVYDFSYDSQNEWYTLLKLKLNLGCRKGNDVLEFYDGQTVVVPTLKGLSALNYKDFVQSTDQVFTYLSEAIMSTYVRYNANNQIKLAQYKDWIILYKENYSDILVYDLRSQSWWTWTSEIKIKQFFSEQDELYFVDVLGNLLNVDFTEDILDYYDKDYLPISWEFESQKMHFNAPNNYKHIRNLSIFSTSKSDESIRVKINFKNYRKFQTSPDYDIVEYEVTGLTNFIKKVNFMKTSAFQFGLSSQPNVFTKFLTPNIAIKYRITERIR